MTVGTGLADRPELEMVPEAEFDRVVMKGASSAIVAFTADWCAPCAWLKPYLYAIMKEVGPEVRVVGVDVDEAAAVVSRFAIGSVPTVLLIRDGSEVDRSVGVEPDRLRRWQDLVSEEVT